MNYQFVQYEKRDKLAYITINRPERHNALHPPANKELLHIFRDFSEDSNVWIAIITGNGDRAFCAGNDLKYTAANWKERESSSIPDVAFGGITSGF